MNGELTLEQVIAFLVDAPMFGDLDASELSQVVQVMQVQRLRAGQWVFREGDIGDAWYVVFDGEVEVVDESPENGDRVIVSSARGSIEVQALVTERFQPFFVEGRLLDEIGIPWHWGYAGIVPGDIANDLTASVGDPNTQIPESKVFLVNIKRKTTRT